MGLLSALPVLRAIGVPVNPARATAGDAERVRAWMEAVRLREAERSGIESDRDGRIHLPGSPAATDAAMAVVRWWIQVPPTAVQSQKPE